MRNNQKKPSILSKVKDSFKLQLLVCFILSSIVIVIFIIINKTLDEIISREYTIVDDIKLINSIENISIEDDDIILKGYAFKLDNNSIGSSISVFLRNVDTGQEVWFDTEQIERYDVNSYYDCEFDYSNSGFVASASSDKLDKDEIYEIIINVDYNNNNTDTKKTRRTVSAQRYIYNEELYAYNPNEFDKPDMDIESELLREVFDNGQLYLYQKDAGMYVYQYMDKLYWIATKDFEFEETGLTYIIYSFYTSQINKLPEDRIQHRFDRLSFYFEEHEYKDEVTVPYRVAIRDIPSDYPITYMVTGIYDTENEIRVWDKYIHLSNVK
ncbi:MAG: hypothetical protein GX323_09725 [Clostridiales bacterium]|nr:hypothetical protein [Clostridiales bacterium]